MVELFDRLMYRLDPKKVVSMDREIEIGLKSETSAIGVEETEPERE
jgi:hypothetical protein